MDLQRVFPQNEVCLCKDERRSRTWRINNINEPPINHVSRWLQTELLSPAINWIEIAANTSPLYEEVIAQRLGLIPINADPLRMELYAQGESSPTQSSCTERSCIVFDLVVENNTQQVMNVTSDQLRWVPFNNQLQIFADRYPKPFYPDLLILRLYPGQKIAIRAYAVLGTGIQHAKWSATNPYFGPCSIIDSLRPTCITCPQLSLTTRYQPGFNCYYFTIELKGGLSYQDVQNQLETRFTWNGLYPPQRVRYFFENQ